MKKVNNIKRTAFFATLAITSATIQMIAQSSYPSFSYSTTSSSVEVEVSTTSQANR